MSTPDASEPDAPRRADAATAAPPGGGRLFLHVLVNTGLANVVTNFLWWALTFWAYLETHSVLATGFIGGAYMLLVAASGMLFGTYVDRHRKHSAMLLSAALTCVAFALAGVLYLLVPGQQLLRLDAPWFWLFAVVILLGGVVEHMRNIALSTTVTLLLEPDRRDRANGLVGAVQGLTLLVTSVFSGLAVGLLGMGPTLAIAVIGIVATGVHLALIRIPEPRPDVDRTVSLGRSVDVRGSYLAVRAAPGLLALLIFSTFNNLVGGVYLALLDPYGLTLFSVETWGIVFAVASTGFIVGGALIGRFGLGPRPMRTLLLVVVAMGALGAAFAIRESWLLFAAGLWLYMLLVPAAEAAEQTVIQKVVPYETQGRVFGFAMMFESAAAPITAFVVAPLAEFAVIPYLRTESGRSGFDWLLGQGEARGIALTFVIAGLVAVVVGLAAFRTRSYRQLSELYARAEPPRTGDAATAPA